MMTARPSSGRSPATPARRWPRLVAGVLAVAVACTGLDREPKRARVPAATTTHTITVGGRAREYTMTVPDAGQEPRALLLVLHGGGGNRARAEAMGFDEVAGADGTVTVYPAAVDGNWNDGRDTTFSTAHREQIDDVEFLLAVVDDVSRRVEVDPERVYATGASNGGMMVLRLACEAADRFAAVVAFIAAAPVPLVGCEPAAPIGVMLIAGTDDPLVPYEGGQVAERGRADRGEVAGVPATFEAWVRADGCAEPTTDDEVDRVDGDGTSIVRHRARGCDGGVEVALVEVRGGGHTIPGGTQYRSRRLVGRVSEETDGVEDAWAFLSRL